MQKTNYLYKTIHYTTNSAKICGNLLKHIPKNKKLIEPFVGNQDMVKLFPDSDWELYDIQDFGYNIVRDTLITPPDYHNKWVITNPPFLAKNKNKDKTIYNIYDTDDLYKAFLLSIIDCEGGIIIIPTNFFTDERTSEIRKSFLDVFSIDELNIFNEPVFNTTTYTVCSFAFHRKENASNQDIKVNIFPQKKSFSILLHQKYNYRVGGEVFSILNETENIFSRLTKKTENKYITNIKLYALDTRKQKIHLEYDENHFYGKNTDRIYATLVCNRDIPIDDQKKLIQIFNGYLNDFREKYCDIVMTNYRDFGRKRISFDFAYQLLSYLYNNNF